MAFKLAIFNSGRLGGGNARPSRIFSARHDFHFDNLSSCRSSPMQWKPMPVPAPAFDACRESCMRILNNSGRLCPRWSGIVSRSLSEVTGTEDCPGGGGGTTLRAAVQDNVSSCRSSPIQWKPMPVPAPAFDGCRESWERCMRILNNSGRSFPRSGVGAYPVFGTDRPRIVSRSLSKVTGTEPCLGGGGGTMSRAAVQDNVFSCRSSPIQWKPMAVPAPAFDGYRELVAAEENVSWVHCMPILNNSGRSFPRSGVGAYPVFGMDRPRIVSRSLSAKISKVKVETIHDGGCSRFANSVSGVQTSSGGWERSWSFRVLSGCLGVGVFLGAVSQCNISQGAFCLDTVPEVRVLPQLVPPEVVDIQAEVQADAALADQLEKKLELQTKRVAEIDVQHQLEAEAQLQDQLKAEDELERRNLLCYGPDAQNYGHLPKKHPKRRGMRKIKRRPDY